MFVRNPELQCQMLLFPGFLIRGPLAAGAGYHLLSPILVTFLQLYCCLSEFLGLHSSWSCTPAGFELVMAVKTSLKVRCWLAATFCWMCVWRLSICWHHHANILPSLEVSASLLSRCCAGFPSQGVAEVLELKSALFSLLLVLLLWEGVCVSMSILGCGSRCSVLLSLFL